MKKILSLCLLLMMVVGCSQTKTNKITIVLDWTPNTNHTGLYVALEKGYFEERGLEVEIVQPPEDGANQLVASNKAQFGVSAQDILGQAFAKEKPLEITAVAAILQHNTSGILSLKEDGIISPAKMENKVYASWDSPVEQAIIKQVVEEDGGDYGKISMVPNTVTNVIGALQSDIDAVWVFYGWDGIAAKQAQLETNYFDFVSYAPELDFYTPVIVANNSYLKENKEEAKEVLAAIQEGYEYAIQNPKEAAQILAKEVPELDEDFLIASQEYLANKYQADATSWGIINQERWDGFYTWLHDNKLIEVEIEAGFGFSNEYLK